MSLAGVTKGKVTEPIWMTLYGPEGCGKTTFAAGAPSPIIIPTEHGSSQIDVARFPRPEKWEDIKDALRTLYLEKHDYKTVIIDTLDAAEALCWAQVVDKAQAESIEAVGGGYGKGYTAALDEWRQLLAALEKLSRAKQMHVILVAHSWVKAFKNPIGEDYERFELKLNAKAAGLIKEWSQAVCFARFEDLASKNEKTKRVRGVSTGARIMLTEHQAAWDAKNRYSLPAQLPLEWSEFFAAVEAGQTQDPAQTRKDIEAAAKQLGGDLEVQALETMKKFGEDAGALARLLSRCNAKLSAMPQKENTPKAKEEVKP
jgi:hypothetical protein